MKNHNSIPLFKNPFLEAFTHIHPLTPLLFWGPIIVWQLRHSLYIEKLDPLITITLMVSALFTWSFVEYILHRFIFHFKANHPWSHKLVYLFHGIHHDDPVDATRLVMPIIPAVIIAGLLYLFFRLLLPSYLARPFLAFFLIGYLCYDYIHFSIHHFVPKTKWGKFLRKSHLVHHVHSHTRFGVSSPLWDYLFQTFHNTPRRTSHK